MISVIAKEKCTGCMACYNICPKDCISIASDKEGFYYPQINQEKCVSCNMCKNVCPVLKPDAAVSYEVSKAWGGYSKDSGVLENSSSGGLFTELAAYVLGRGGCVYGAGFEEDFRAVRHMKIENLDDLCRLRCSKYVQSNINDIFKDLRKELTTGRIVMFTGTPCQIYGLRGFLGKEPENLLLVDIVCHGVPSELLWNTYLDSMKKEFPGNIKHVNFRDKTNGWSDFSSRIDFNGQVYLRSHNSDPYMQMFLQNYCLRESCYHCIAKTRGYCSDISLADFWGLKRINARLYKENGVSLALIHTAKGLHFLNEISENVSGEFVDYDSVMNRSSHRKPVKRPFARNYFYLLLDKLSWGRFQALFGHKRLDNTIKEIIIRSPVGLIRKQIKDKLSRK